MCAQRVAHRLAEEDALAGARDVDRALEDVGLDDARKLRERGWFSGAVARL